MKHRTIKTRTNIFWIGFVFVLLIFSVAYTSIFFYWGYSLYSVESLRSEAYIFLIPVIPFVALTIFAFYAVSNRMNYAVANKRGLKIIFPMKFKSVFLEWTEIRGYSKSDYYYGGKPSFKSKSIVIYARSQEIYEIIKLYNFDFQNFQTNLRKFNIICFGHEGFTTKTSKLIFRKRVYKYKDLFN